MAMDARCQLQSPRSTKMKILCVFGKNQYGDVTRGTSTECAAFIPALERLGHEVIFFDSWDRTLYSDFAELNGALLDIVEREKPEILLAVHMLYEVWTETIDIISSRGDVTTICWTTDDSWKYVQSSRFIGRSYHLITTTYPQFVRKYVADGIPNVFLTQWAASDSALAVPLPAAECRYGVTFVGAAHGDRKQRIDWLREHGVDVACFGYGWTGGSLTSSEMSEVIRNSIISLNFANSKGDNQIKARTFEVPGAGGFLMSECATGIEQCYVDGKEFVIFKDMDDLLVKIRYYLDHPDERDIIARNGYERTSSEHTYTIRLRNILEHAVDNRQKRVRQNDNRPVPDFEAAVAAHHLTPPLLFLRTLLLIPFVLFWGKTRGRRALRRLMFEVSWRFFGSRTYSAAGLPGRMFYRES